MDWFPLVKPHTIESPRWSTKHNVDLLEKLTAPLIDPAADHCEPERGVQLLTLGLDLVYVSSSTTLTVLHSALDTPLPGAKSPQQTPIAGKAALIPTISDIQVFETQLSVFGLCVGSGNCVYAHTLYSVFILSKEEETEKIEIVEEEEEDKKMSSKYSLRLLYSTEDQILDFREVDGVLHVLTTSQLFTSPQPGIEQVGNYFKVYSFAKLLLSHSI